MFSNDDFRPSHSLSMDRACLMTSNNKRDCLHSQEAKIPGGTPDRLPMYRRQVPQVLAFGLWLSRPSPAPRQAPSAPSRTFPAPSICRRYPAFPPQWIRGQDHKANTARPGPNPNHATDSPNPSLHSPPYPHARNAISRRTRNFTHNLHAINRLAPQCRSIYSHSTPVQRAETSFNH